MWCGYDQWKNLLHIALLIWKKKKSFNLYHTLGKFSRRHTQPFRGIKWKRDEKEIMTKRNKTTTTYESIIEWQTVFSRRHTQPFRGIKWKRDEKEIMTKRNKTTTTYESITEWQQCRSWWDGSLRAVSLGPTLFAKVSVLVCRDERVRPILLERNLAFNFATPNYK